MSKCCCEDNTAIIAQLQDRMNAQETALAPFLSGHPLLPVQEDSDIAAFDTVTGWGSGTWAGWAIANGTVYTNGSTTVATYDMRDNVPVGSGLTYTPGQALGAAQHTLTPLEIPIHTHAVTDPGHTHVVTDPGHVHATTDPGHTHAGSQPAHSHPFTTTTDGSHTHASVQGGLFVTTINAGLFLDGTAGASDVNDTDSIAANGDHNHTGTTDSTTPAVTVGPAFVGTSVNSALAGVTVASAVTGVSNGNAGGDLPHNNMQPSVGTLWVQRIYNA